MKIEIKKLVLHNFKGQRHIEIPLQPGMNTLAGRNATGKTTIFDAFAWALFGKDSEDRTDFNVKTLNPDGEPEHHLEHFVELHLMVDDRELTLKRILEEKWTKPKGKKDLVFTGHETSYYVNEVPCSMKEYNLKVETICRPDVFKFITNPLYFPTMQWTKQREILTAIAGEISENEVPKSKALIELLDRITGKTLKEYRAEIAKKKQLAQDELQGIDPRVKENELKKSEILGLKYDYPEIEKSMLAIQNEISLTDQSIAEVAKQKGAAGYKRLKIQSEINTLKIDLGRIETEVRLMANVSRDNAKIELERTTNQLKSKIREKEELIETNNNQAANLTMIEQKITDLRAKWHEENDKKITFSSEVGACPTCGRPFDESEIEEKKASLVARFNESKAKRLAEIETEGKELASRKEAKKAQIQEILNDITKLTRELEDLESQKKDIEGKIPPEIVSITPMLDANTEYQAAIEKIAELEKSLSEVKVPGVEEYQTKRRDLETDLTRIRAVLATKTTIADCDTRIEELKANQVKLNQAIADYERDENTMLDHTKAYIRIVEERVNSMFEITRFKMFNILINGNEEATCECMVNGVPFRDLNNGMKITVGLDIINTLSDYYHIHAPVFIDNAEAVNVIPEIHTQVIGLYVTEDDLLQVNGKAAAKLKEQLYETVN